MQKRRRNLLERHGKTVRRSIIERTQVAEAGQSVSVDTEKHLIRDLCMLGPTSRNGRSYTPEAMEQLAKLYEGARAYQDHPDDATAPRSTRERLGRWRNIRLVDGKIRGDLHYDPHHPYADSLVWAVQNCPEHCGASHNIEAEGYEEDDGHFTITRPTEVRSVDIVDDPATNKSLLESRQPKRHRRTVRRKAKEGAMDPELDDLDGGMDAGGETPDEMLGKYVTACFHDPNMSKEQKLEKLKTVFSKLLDDAETGGDDMDAGMGNEEEDLDMTQEDDGEDEEDVPEPQEKETDDQFEEEDPDEPSDADIEKTANWMRDCPDTALKSGKANESAKKVRESLQRLRKHKDKNVRTLAENALRALPKLPAKKHPRRAPVTESLGRHQDPAVRAMAKRLDVLEAEKIAATAIRQAITECRKARLPARMMTRLFIEDLAECTNPKRRKAMIQERAHIASINLPRSDVPGGVGGGAPRVSDADFAAMVNGEAD